MVKNIFSGAVVSLFWIIAGVLISSILNYFFLGGMTNLFIKVGITRPSILESMDALFFICITSFLITLLIQKKVEIFKNYNKTSTIVLLAIIGYLSVNFVSLVMSVEFPRWFTFPFRL